MTKQIGQGIQRLKLQNAEKRTNKKEKLQPKQ